VWQDEDDYDYGKLVLLLSRLNVNVIIGTFFLYTVCLTTNQFLWVTLFLLGTIAAFTATAFFNLGAMMAVPKENRGKRGGGERVRAKRGGCAGVSFVEKLAPSVRR